MGHYDEARREFERAQRVFEETLGPTHPFVVENVTQHAELLRRVGDDAGAETPSSAKAAEGRRTRMSVGSGDFKPNRKGRRINVYLIRRPFPFTRVARSALQSEGYGHPDGHLSWRARSSDNPGGFDDRLTPW
jgi:hypothetical protein